MSSSLNETAMNHESERATRASKTLVTAHFELFIGDGIEMVDLRSKNSV